MAELDSARMTRLKDRILIEMEAAEAAFDRIESSEGRDAAEQKLGIRAATLRLIECAVRDRDVTARTQGDCDGCPDEAVRNVLKTMAEQRAISAREYDEAGRIREAEREREELSIIQEFLPKPLDEGELEQAVQGVLDELDASTLKDLGRCMSALKARYPGKIDSRKAGKVVKRALQ